MRRWIRRCRPPPFRTTGRRCGVAPCHAPCAPRSCSASPANQCASNSPLTAWRCFASHLQTPRSANGCRASTAPIDPRCWPLHRHVPTGLRPSPPGHGAGMTRRWPTSPVCRPPSPANARDTSPSCSGPLHFEAYSAECAHRSAADAALHNYLGQVTAASRARFEEALERVAVHGRAAVGATADKWAAHKDKPLPTRGGRAGGRRHRFGAPEESGPGLLARRDCAIGFTCMQVLQS